MKTQLRPRAVNAAELMSILEESRDGLITLANKLGGCSLDGEPAELHMPEVGSRFWRVVGKFSGEGARFSDSVVGLVLKEGGGRFRTRELRKYSCV